MDALQLLHHATCGGVAAAGFGVLFNVRYRALPGCAATGALALAIRTVAMQNGWNLIAASFLAALALGVLVQMFQSKVGASRNALAVAGCIPMVPGAFAAKAILGLFAVSAQHPTATTDTLIVSLEFSLRVLFTVGALGTGLAIPSFLSIFRPDRPDVQGRQRDIAGR